MSGKGKMALRVNGETHEVAFAPHKPLLEVLRSRGSGKLLTGPRRRRASR